MRTYTIRNILVPIDFFPLSLKALEHAERIAKGSKATITLVHVIESIIEPYATDQLHSTLAQAESDLQLEASDELLTIATESSKRSGARVLTKVVVGSIAATINVVAKDIDADLIVMGTHGSMGFVDSLLGSSTYHVTQLCQVPVLSVHKGIARAGYKHIIYPVRQRGRGLDKLPYALALAGLFKARVHVLGFANPRHGKPDKSISSQCRIVKEQFRVRGVAAVISYARGEHFAKTVIRTALAYPDSITVLIQDHDFHLVDLFRKPFAQKVFQRAFAPVLTIPPR